MFILMHILPNFRLNWRFAWTLMEPTVICFIFDIAYFWTEALTVRIWPVSETARIY